MTTQASEFSQYMADIWEVYSEDAIIAAKLRGAKRIGIGRTTMPDHSDPNAFKQYLFEFPDGSRAWISEAEVELIDESN